MMKIGHNLILKDAEGKVLLTHYFDTGESVVHSLFLPLLVGEIHIEAVREDYANP